MKLKGVYGDVLIQTGPFISNPDLSYILVDIGEEYVVAIYSVEGYRFDNSYFSYRDNAVMIALTEAVSELCQRSADKCSDTAKVSNIVALYGEV